MSYKPTLVTAAIPMHNEEFHKGNASLMQCEPPSMERHKAGHGQMTLRQCPKPRAHNLGTNMRPNGLQKSQHADRASTLEATCFPIAFRIACIRLTETMNTMQNRKIIAGGHWDSTVVCLCCGRRCAFQAEAQLKTAQNAAK